MEVKLDEPVFRKTINSPVGDLLLIFNNTHLISLGYFDNASLESTIFSTDFEKSQENSLFKEIEGQITAYFAGTLKNFNLPLDELGTPFQKEVWCQLRNIPFGETISYRTLAERLGDPKKIRAAASANGKNPIMLINPCHRVIGIDGKMVGYVGGIERKRKLILHEQNISKQTELLF
jgi:methylated-DNA-[protein]-cysteine S-methyltransferase